MQNSEQSYKLSHLGTQPQPSFPLLVLIFQGRYIYIYVFFFFPLHQPQLAAVASSLPLRYFTPLPLLAPAVSLLPAALCVHTLFSKARSEKRHNRVSQHPAGRPGPCYFLPISFASFGRLNNVCVSGAASRLDAGPCRWESSACQVCH